ncbi:transcriptional regulator [Flavitalea sp. BT771]|uniref:helix-turn-helix domain-containing protein n=1 Tax=Flavitalea sp. BT771 TaxID=3063329 RepID=UPI0026E2FDDB|nr:transcriptional regulator [Flavitalea sp. BT771]MDO6430751.1 transcriptional regulator [Flavitalea sp. BT771]MDV6219109.1 transcriptional regulator [Flavitalea sp. BT771]
MAELKYKVIKNKIQYNDYCKKLENLVFSGSKDSRKKDEIDLLTVLIEKWDAEHNTFDELDPIQLLLSFMEDQKLKPKDLIEILGISKGYISEILHYKKGLSKDVIRKLAGHFKVTQEAFNRPYKLIAPINAHLKNARVMNTKRKAAVA